MPPLGRTADVEILLGSTKTDTLTVHCFNKLENLCKKVLTKKGKYYITLLG